MLRTCPDARPWISDLFREAYRSPSSCERLLPSDFKPKLQENVAIDVPVVHVDTRHKSSRSSDDWACAGSGKPGPKMHSGRLKSVIASQSGGGVLEPPLFGGRTLADRAFEWLEEAIIKGDYQPGSKLDEVALAKSFGISRGPVREAIRRLEGKKLVNRVPNVGARVSAVQPSDLADLLYVREALEGMACRLATERMTDAELSELAKLLEGHAAQRSLKAGDNYYQRPGDYDFHFRIIQGSHSAKLIEMLCDDLYYLLRIFRYRSSFPQGPRPRSSQGTSGCGKSHDCARPRCSGNRHAYPSATRPAFDPKRSQATQARIESSPQERQAKGLTPGNAWTAFCGHQKAVSDC